MDTSLYRSEIHFTRRKMKRHGKGKTASTITRAQGYDQGSGLPSLPQWADLSVHEPRYDRGQMERCPDSPPRAYGRSDCLRQGCHRRSTDSCDLRADIHGKEREQTPLRYGSVRLPQG